MKAAIIISAYNEASRIGAVIEAALASLEADEVIIVDDGSSDGTAETAAAYPVKVIHRSRNVGKGGAMVAGMRATDADVLVFIDADLTGLAGAHLDALIKPLRDDPDLEMTAGRFVGGRLATNLSQKLMPSINSQRAIRRAVMDKVPDFRGSRYGVETVINDYVKHANVTTMAVKLDGVSQVMKEEKNGLAKGAYQRARMYGDIIKSKSPRGAKKKNTPS